MTVKSEATSTTDDDAPQRRGRKPVSESSSESRNKPYCSSQVDAAWVERNLGLTSSIESPCEVCGTMKPAYNSIQLPYVLFYRTIMEEGVSCLWQYTDHLRFADFVPYMLTEYIDDEGEKERVRARFRPEKLNAESIELILTSQPAFACYFDHL